MIPKIKICITIGMLDRLFFVILILTILNIVVQILVKIWFISQNILYVSNVMTLLKSQLFVNVKHLHVHNPFFEQLDAVHVTRVKISWLSKYARVVQIKI